MYVCLCQLQVGYIAFIPNITLNLSLCLNHLLLSNKFPLLKTAELNNTYLVLLCRERRCMFDGNSFLSLFLGIQRPPLIPSCPPCTVSNPAAVCPLQTLWLPVNLCRVCYLMAKTTAISPQRELINFYLI